MNALFDFARQSFLEGEIAWLTDPIRGLLIDATQYQVSLGGHRWLADVSTDARIMMSGTLTGRTSAAGVAGADNLRFSAVTGPPVTAVLIYHDTGIESTSTLIAYIEDSPDLPVNPDGGDIAIRWDTGPNRIFKL